MLIEREVVKFNMYVKNLIAELLSRGETTNDLLVNLFKGYGVASDKMFRDYISHKEDRYDEGEDIIPDELMNLASNKYKVLKDKGLWNAPSSEEEKIIALEAKIKDLTKSKGAKEYNKYDKKGSTPPMVRTTSSKEGET